MSTGTDFDKILKQFEAISLKEVNKASLMRRKDNKYLFSYRHLPALLEMVSKDYRVLEIEIPERIIDYPYAADLPAGWDYRGPPLPAPQLWGDRWLDSFSSAVICVPSAVVPSEVNYLLNPLHGDFAQINVPGGPTDYPFDPRIKS